MISLDKLKMLEKLDNSEIKYLEMLSQERFLQAGECLFKEGEEANSMYLLYKGELEAFKTMGNEEIVLGNIKAEEVVGEMGVFGEKNKRTASVRAVKDSVLIVLLAFAIKELTLKHPNIMNKIIDIIEERRRENKKKLELEV